MFEAVGVPVLGVIENMSTFICSPCCDKETEIFGSGGGERLAQESGVTLLGKLPLDGRIRAETDGGRPTVVADPDGPIANRYREIARAAAAGRWRSGRRTSAASSARIVVEGRK
jgi:ATP-binding protein involved in chromosome partitioning